MPTTLNPQAWSTTAADNDDADAGINWVEGQARASVNNSARAMMAAEKRFILDLCGKPAAVGGSADAHTVTTNQALSAGHITDGLQISYRAPGTNTIAAPTLSIDGTAAAILRRADGTALAIGSIVSGMILIVQRQDTAGEFWVLNIIAASTEVNIDGMATDNAIDFEDDSIPYYDDSANANRKTKPQYLAQSSRACFSVHRNGTDQTISSTDATQVGWSTESFDVGSHFVANRWTPPAGKVRVDFIALLHNAGTSGSIELCIYRGGLKAMSVTVSPNSDGVASGLVTLIDDADGLDYYETYVDSSTDASYLVKGTETATKFMGTMI